MPFLDALDDAGEYRGVTASTVIHSPSVSIYDGSSDATDGKVGAMIEQFDANANDFWSTCSWTYTAAGGNRVGNPKSRELQLRISNRNSDRRASQGD